MHAVRSLAAVAFAGAILIGVPAQARASDPPKKAKVAAKAAAAKPAAAKPAAKEAHAAATPAAAKHEAPAKEAGKEVHVTPKTAAAPKAAPGPANLEVVAQRIQQSLAEATKDWPASKPARPAAPRARAAAARPAVARVRLVWRPSVSWPAELQDASDAYAPTGERVPVSWSGVIR